METERACGFCDHDPACGQSSITQGDDTTWFCHTDDHSCYVAVPLTHAMGAYPSGLRPHTDTGEASSKEHQ